MTDLPLISVIMPAFNSEKYISESIESVLDQTYQKWELIIVDDGSIDKTGKIAKYYAEKDSRIKYIYQENQKQGKARNNGIKTSKGELIAFLDSDDLWISEKLEIQLEILKKTKADLLFSNGYIFTNNRNEIKYSFQTITGFLQGDDAVKLFLVQNRIPILSVLVTKNAIESIGGFEEDINIQSIEDYYLWIKLLLNGNLFYGMPEKLVYYRLHESQVTAKDPTCSEKVFFMLVNNINIPERFFPSIIKAKFLWCRTWYDKNADNKKSAINILCKMSVEKQLKSITILTSISLIFFGVNYSKKVLSKLINIKLKKIEINVLDT